MYGWVWRRLPGGRNGKTAVMALIVVGLIILLWVLVFPWASIHLPIDQAGVGG